MKILLISANTVTTPYPVYPVGLDYVAGAIAHRHQVKIADINFMEGGELFTLIKTFKPDVVGVSLRNVDNSDIENPKLFIPGYQDLCVKIRQYTKALLVIGGSGFTIFPEEILTSLKADFGIIGEGERLLQLLDAIENETDPSQIPGVISPDIPCRIPPPIDHTVLRPIAAAEDHHLYYLQHGGMLNLQTHRGCPFGCVYCTYPHIEGRRIRVTPPSEVAKTATRLAARGAKYLFITDSTFNANVDHSAAVAEAFIRAGIRVPWGCFFAPIAPPKGYFRLLVRAGLAHIEFGTESLSNRVLKAYGKPFTAEAVIKTHQRAVAAGLNVAHYILLGGPGETKQTIAETLTTIDKLKKTVIFIFSGMRIYPHTALYDLACREGQITAGENLLEPVFYQPPGIDTARIIKILHSQTKNHGNWVFGDGGDETATAISTMYRGGYSGPLWEHLIQ